MTPGTPYPFLKAKTVELVADALNALLHAHGAEYRVMRGDFVLERRGGYVMIAFPEVNTERDPGTDARHRRGAEHVA